MAAPAAHAQAVHNFNLPAQALSQSLKKVASQTRSNIVYDPASVRGKVAPRLRGSFTTQQALDYLLTESGLSARLTNGRSWIVEPASGISGDANTNIPPDRRSSAASKPLADQSQTGSAQASEAAIVITGTNIRGLKSSPAPVQIITRKEIERTNYSTVEDVIRDLSQNLGEISATSVLVSNKSLAAGQNLERSSGISLRGLGPGSTLTLLNGTRRPGAAHGLSVDISMIPLSVIERIDVVTGGYSAVYGSDAVAGVVNLVTRRAYDGAETQIFYGDSEFRGGGQARITQTMGLNGSRAGIVAAYEGSHTGSLDIVNTKVRINDAAGPPILSYLIIPEMRSHSAFVAGHFDPSSSFEITVDGYYGKRRNKGKNSTLFPANFLRPGAPESRSSTKLNGNIEEYGAAPSIAAKLGGSWRVDLTGVYGVVDTESKIINAITDTVTLTEAYRSSLISGAAVFSGTLFNLAGRPVKTAFGAEVRRESLKEGSLPSFKRSVRSAFGELSVPILSSVDASVAGRYDHYSDFGGTFNPQAGLVWRPVPDIRLRGTFAKAFRAPDLFALHITPSAVIARFPDPASPTGFSPILWVSGGNPALDPEKAKTWTIGADLTPRFLPRFRLSASYFSVDYRNRLGNITITATTPSTLLADADRGLFPGVVQRNPSAEQLAAILATFSTPIINHPTFPTGIPFNRNTQQLLTVFPSLVLLDNRVGNNAVERARGLDGDMSMNFDLAGGTLLLSARASYMLKFERSVTRTSPPISLINTTGRPVDFNARGGVSYTYGPYGIFTYVNYTDSYRHNVGLSAPTVKIPSWTTVDVSLQFDGRSLPKGNWLRGFMFTLGADNVFNKTPPHVPISIGLDLANAEPSGISYAFRVLKRW